MCLRGRSRGEREVGDTKFQRGEKEGKKDREIEPETERNTGNEEKEMKIVGNSIFHF